VSFLYDYDQSVWKNSELVGNVYMPDTLLTKIMKPLTLLNYTSIPA